MGTGGTSLSRHTTPAMQGVSAMQYMGSCYNQHTTHLLLLPLSFLSFLLFLSLSFFPFLLDELFTDAALAGQPHGRHNSTHSTKQ